MKKKILADAPEVLQVDWFYNQYENTEDGNLVWTTPSVYLEFSQVAWAQRGARHQVASISVIFHVVSASGYGAEDYQQTEPTDGLVINHLDLCDKLYRLFQSFSCGYQYLSNFSNEPNWLISSMVRVSTEVSHELNVFNVTKITFDLNIQDVGAIPDQIVVLPPIALVVSAEIVNVSEL